MTPALNLEAALPLPRRHLVTTRTFVLDSFYDVLVSRVGNSFTKSSERFQDLVGGFGPDEKVSAHCCGVPGKCGGLFQSPRAAVNATAQLLFSKQPKEAFD